MGKRGVIRKVEEPSDWVNSMPIVEKPDGSFRFCLDPRQLNPTIDDVTTRMANANGSL